MKQLSLFPGGTVLCLLSLIKSVISSISPLQPISVLKRGFAHALPVWTIRRPRSCRLGIGNSRADFSRLRSRHGPRPGPFVHARVGMMLALHGAKPIPETTEARHITAAGALRRHRDGLSVPDGQ